MTVIMDMARVSDHCEDCLRIIVTEEPYDTCEFCGHVFLLSDGQCSCSSTMIARGEEL